MRKYIENSFLLIVFFLVQVSCKEKVKNISASDIDKLDLKRGDLVLCGPADKQFGTVAFDISCSEKVKKEFNLAIALLHSFEYDEAEKVFAGIIEKEPSCAMAYWGVAMCNFHPLWAPPSAEELTKGLNAIALGKSILQKSGMESDYIDAIGKYYTDADKYSHHTRCLNYEKAMEQMYLKYPGEMEVALFYVLAMDAAVDPTDKSQARQIRAGKILNGLYQAHPNHPGIVHYIIHNYDYPGLAELALPAARKYASVAPSSAHALHMPSHIFTRLGLWDECIQSNIASTEAAKCYAENMHIKGHWDEELHGLDYLVYAYLQKGDDESALKQLKYLQSIKEVHPVNFKVAYAFAAIPCRYALENRNWEAAARLQIVPAIVPWQKFSWQKAMIYFSRLMGFVHMDRLDSAGIELRKLKEMQDTLIKEKDPYKANQVNIEIKISEAWILFKQGENKNAAEQMNAAAAMEDATEKSPVTPGELLPARELLGDMLMGMGSYILAEKAFQEDLTRHPNRFNGLYGAGQAAEKSGDKKNALLYYQQLADICGPHSTRPELMKARMYLSSHKKLH